MNGSGPVVEDLPPWREQSIPRVPPLVTELVVLVHLLRQFLHRVPSPLTEAHDPGSNRRFTDSVAHLGELN